MARFHHRSKAQATAAIFCQRQRFLARIYMPFRLEAPSCFYLHALVILLKSLRVAVPGDGIRFSGTPARSAPIKPNIMGTKLQHKSPRPSPNPNCTPNPNYIRPRTHMRQNLARKCMNLINKSRILLAADLFAVVPFSLLRRRRSYPQLHL